MLLRKSMLNQTPFPNRGDRIDALKQKIEGFKRNSVDYQFTQYLDQVLHKLQMTETDLEKTEKHLVHSYQMYLQRNGLVQPPVQPGQGNVPPQNMQQAMTGNAQNVPPYAQTVLQNQNGQSVPHMSQYAQTTPQNQNGQSVPPMQQNMQRQAQQQFRQQPQVQPVPPHTKNKRTLEYRIGTAFLGVVGILFILIAFVTFGLQYMSSTLQGILFYILGVAIFAGSELFLAKKLEKFSYFVSGLGIAGLYITTILNYLYLKIFPSYAALIITVAVTAFFIWYSRRKDSAMMRIICLLGCYISLVPLGELDNLIAFAIPALIIFALNLTGFLCPVKGKNVIADYVQYICTIAFLFYMDHLLYISGLQMWPLYLLVCGCIVTLHLLCLGRDKNVPYLILYWAANVFFFGFLWSVGNYEDWMIWGVVGVAVIGAVFTFLYLKTHLFCAPYVMGAVYALVAFQMCDNKLAVCLCGMIVFVINRLFAAFRKEYAPIDAVYTMFAVLYVCFLTRNDDVRLLGYAFACVIIIGAFFVKKYKQYHLYTAVSFAWLFLLTEKMYPLICSVLICILAAALIGGGFIKKDKAIRIYGLCLIIFVALKLVGYDFKEAEAMTRIIVFLIVGLVILGVSFLYIYLEKRQAEQQQVQQSGIQPQPAYPQPGMQPQPQPVNIVPNVQNQTVQNQTVQSESEVQSQPETVTQPEISETPDDNI